MVPRRHVKPPALNCAERSRLDSEKCPSVDAVLKQLKACSRRLQTALSAHRTELQVLERLYYKGKNQHRTALFWQRVAEMRKLGERVDEMHMDDVVESLRLSFWGEPSGRTTKVMKGPWTHYPDAKALLFVLERCSACCMLIEAAEHRLISAYESFTLMMQTTAFLQLILTLVAVVSRLRILMGEVKSALEVSWSASFKALQTVFPSELEHVRMHLNTEESNVSSLANRPSLEGFQSTHAQLLSTEAHDEDLGSSLNRPALVAVESLAASISSVSNARLPEAGDDEDIVDATSFSLQSELQVVRKPDQTRASHSKSTTVPVVASTQTSTSQTKRKKINTDTFKSIKKKKKKQDEIDAIFGF